MKKIKLNNIITLIIISLLCVSNTQGAYSKTQGAYSKSRLLQVADMQLRKVNEEIINNDPSQALAVKNQYENHIKKIIFKLKANGYSTEIVKSVVRVVILQSEKLAKIESSVRPRKISEETLKSFKDICFNQVWSELSEGEIAIYRNSISADINLDLVPEDEEYYYYNVLPEESVAERVAERVAHCVEEKISNL